MPEYLSSEVAVSHQDQQPIRNYEPTLQGASSRRGRTGLIRHLRAPEKRFGPFSDFEKVALLGAQKGIPMKSSSHERSTQSTSGSSLRASSRALLSVLNLLILACAALPPLGLRAAPLLQAGPLITIQSFNFGNVLVGSSASYSVTLANRGEQSVTIVAVQGSGAPFGFSGITVPLTVSPGQSLTFSTQFSPSSTGVFNGSVTLTASSGQQVMISLSGTGITTYLTLTPTSLNFGNTVLGETSSLSVLATNTGTTAVTISSNSLSGTGFSLDDLNLPITLNPNQSTSFSVTFAPNSAGSSAGTVSLMSNATDSPALETLSGEGIHAVSLSWTASTSSGVTGYDIYRSSVSGGPYTEVTTSPVAGTNYTDTTVAAGQTYFYVAAAVGSGGTSAYSNQAQATVPSP